MTGTKTILAFLVLAAMAMAVFGQQTDEAWLEEGNVNNNQSMYEDTIKDYEEAIRLDTKKYADAWYKKAEALKNLGRYDEAFLAYEKAIHSYNEVIQAYEENIRADDKAIRMDDETILVGGEVIQAYGEAIPPASVYNDTWHSKSVALTGEGEYDGATQAYEEAIMPDLECADIWYNNGLALANLGKYEEAIQAYDEAIMLDPEYGDAWYNKGLALAAQGKYEEAIQAYDGAICRLDPIAAQHSNQAGLELFSKGYYSEALEKFKRATEEDPENADAWHNKGLALERLGRISEANEAYEKAEKLGWGGSRNRPSNRLCPSDFD